MKKQFGIRSLCARLTALAAMTAKRPRGFGKRRQNARAESLESLESRLLLSATVGDFAWQDLDGNGQQDVGEPGLNGVLVELRDAGTNSLVASTTTATISGIAGAYSFSGLSPGDYRLTFNPLPGFSRTAANVDPDATDSDADVGTGVTQVFTLGTNDINNTIDAGYVTGAAIGNFVWNDLNADGIQDPAEPGIPGVTVNLYNLSNTLIDSTTTDANGMYWFTNVTPGAYYLNFAQPPGFAFASPQDTGINDDRDDSDADPFTGNTPVYEVSVGGFNDTVDAGYYNIAYPSIGDFVWDDLNGNGQQDPGEPGINGVTVTLIGAGPDFDFDTAGDNTTDVTVTAFNGTNNGAYSFTDLEPGLYTLFFTGLPSGYEFTTPLVGDFLTDSDVLDPDTGMTDIYFLNFGDNFTSIDAGAYKTVSIGNYAWVDSNGNGIQDIGESPLANVTVTLTGTSGSGAAVGPVSTLTDGSGLYSFSNLAPGSYWLSFAAPTSSGYVLTAANQGSDDSLDSDATPAGASLGSTGNYSLISGDTNDTADAGFYLPVTISNFVWTDTNGDGIQNDGATGIGGVSVTILYAGPDGDFNTTGDNVSSTVVTNASGIYSFSGAPGNYRVSVATPATYVPTATGQGTTATDSNVSPTTLTLTSGQSDDTIDFGFYRPATLGNYAWIDANGNGIQDVGESPLANVTVTLTGTSGSGVSVGPVSTLTNGSGLYSFSNLVPGNYKVTFGAVAGYSRTVADTGPDATDSDANVSTGMTGVYTLVSGQYNDTVDAGYVPFTTTISGVKYQDLTGNGLSVDDTPLGGTVINLYKDTNLNGVRDSGDGAAVATTTTAAVTGAYSFSVATFGLYFAEEVVPSGFVRTTPTFNNYIPITVASNVNYTGNNFANFKKCDLSHLSNVYYVINGYTTVTNLRGNVNQGDTVAAHFTITSGAAAHQYSLVSYTAPSAVFVESEASQQQVFNSATGVFGPGSYVMTVVIPNCNFQVDFVCGAILAPLGPAGSNIFYTPQGRLISADNDGTQTCADSSLSGYVYVDSNKNGVRNSGEAGIGGVSVTLTGTNIYGAAVSRNATTNSSGYYVFSNLKASNAAGYRITETQPSGYLDGTDAIGSQGGTTGNDVLITGLLNTNTSGINNNFGEWSASSSYTKFYVVNSGSTDQTYEYEPSGALVESNGLNSGNTTPRGIATTIAGDKVWIVDANKTVYVYDTSGGLLGSWKAGTLSSSASVQGITTDGTNVWIVDAYSDKVYKFTGAASKLSGTLYASSSFKLNSGNTTPKGLVTDGASIWVVNDSKTDKVFKYTISGTCRGSWTIDAQNAAPTGITIDPSDVNHIWIVDSSTRKVYQYSGAASRVSGSQSAAASFQLAAGNNCPQGIADPPPAGSFPASARQNPAVERHGISSGPTLNRVADQLTTSIRSSREAGPHDLQRIHLSSLAVAVRSDLATHARRNRRTPLLAPANPTDSLTWLESTPAHSDGLTQVDDLDAVFSGWETDPLELLAASASRRN